MLFGNSTVNTFYQAGSIVVPSVTTQGSRTVGNFSITVPVPNDLQYVWALVYVPQGTSANNLFATTGGMRVASMNLINTLLQPELTMVMQVQFVLDQRCNDVFILETSLA